MNPENETDSDGVGELIRSAGRRPTPSPSDYEAVLSAATAAWRTKVNAGRRRRRAMAAAAVLALVAILLIPWLRTTWTAGTIIGTTMIVRGDVAMLAPGAASWSPLPANRIQPLVRGTRLRTNAAGRLTLRLGPGIEVRVNQNSEIQLTTLERIDMTTGTLYVDSGPLAAPSRLRIQTGLGALRDIGTQFEVHAGAEQLRLRVREGRVVLEDEAGLRLESEAGQQLTLDDSGQLQRSAFRTDDPAWHWAERLTPGPELEGQTVQSFLSWIARETGRRLMFAEPGVELRARTVRLRSSVNLEDLTPLEMLDAVLATTNFSYIIREDGVILIERR